MEDKAILLVLTLPLVLISPLAFASQSFGKGHIASPCDCVPGGCLSCNGGQNCYGHTRNCSCGVFIVTVPPTVTMGDQHVVSLQNRLIVAVEWRAALPDARLEPTASL